MPAHALRARLRAVVRAGRGAFDCTVLELGTESALLEARPEAGSLALGQEASCEVALDAQGARLTLPITVAKVVAEMTDHRGRSCAHIVATVGALTVEERDALRDALALHRPTLLFVGDALERWEPLADRLRGVAAPLFVQRAQQVISAFDEHEVCGVVCGSDLDDAAAVALLTEIAKTFPSHPGAHVVLGAREVSVFQELVDDDRLFYLTGRAISLGDRVAILQAAVARYQAAVAGRPNAVDASTEAVSRMARVVESLSKDASVARIVATVEKTLRDLARADRAYCLLYDPKEAILWSDRAGEDRRAATAATGIAGFVARTGIGVRLNSAMGDCRFDRDSDDPDAAADARLVCEPIARARGDVLAVLIVARDADQPAFSDSDQQLVQLLAVQLSPLLSQRALRSDIGAAVEKQSRSWIGLQTHLYRTEALLHHTTESGAGEGALLNVNPRWVTWLYRTVFALAVAGGVYLALGRMHQYASGPAIIRALEQTPVSSTGSGVVTEHRVSAGSRVRAGDVLLTLHDGAQAAALARIDEELQVVAKVRERDPQNQAARQKLEELRLDRELAEARLDHQFVRAPREGVVSDLRARPGQTVASGEQLAWIRDLEPDFAIVALIPGSYRPQLQVGDLVRLEIDGYRNAYQAFRVESIGELLAGASEARRFLGPDVPTRLIPSEPFVVVTARTSRPTFDIDGQSFSYFDGMTGTAAIRVRSESLLVTLIPGLRGVGRVSP